MSVSREEYVRDYPEVKGLSEIHIFLEPLNPDPQTVKAYQDLVEQYNKTQLKEGEKFTMKGCYLCLNYRALGDVKVMQSSRYFYGQDSKTVIEETYKDGKWFSDHGFKVLRHKIECITTATGVPQGEEWVEHPKRYFEFHIRVNRKEEDDPDALITDSEINWLKSVAKDFTEEFQTPVPLSYNDTLQFKQRYLNVRFANCGAEYARDNVEKIKKAIEDSPTLKWVKTISEYVWYDDHRAVDSGWIDFTDEEKRSLLHLKV
eukprot:TRINITY_DN5242_c0_g1_i1.p1 TRINITY_DN5242_c0_g1~~TRINITY_DN5242_c0_g1_i1.p1  ORF type:complete len:275 (+),score=54.68 TRINITY_DN5242_c0_g1_i1:48-827(+)